LDDAASAGSTFPPVTLATETAAVAAAVWATKLLLSLPGVYGDAVICSDDDVVRHVVDDFERNVGLKAATDATPKRQDKTLTEIFMVQG